MKDKELLQRYQTTRILLDSVQKTIDNPDKSVTDNLAEGDKTSKKMALVLAKSGSLASEATLASIGTGVIVASKVGVFGITAAAVAGLLTGPLVLGGGIVSLILTFIYKIIERRRSPLWKQKHEERLRRAKEKRTARAENPVRAQFSRRAIPWPARARRPKPVPRRRADRKSLSRRKRSPPRPSWYSIRAEPCAMTRTS